jgi:hypothetical protein
MTAGMQAERPRCAQQLHASFLRCSAPLPVIAGMAARNKVLPSRFAGPRSRNNVIERHLAGWQRAMAILAGIAIPHQYIFSRKCACLMGNAPVFQQPDNGRHTQRTPGGMHLRWRKLFGRGNAFQNQHHCPARGTDVDGLVARVKDKNGSMKSIQAGHRTSFVFSVNELPFRQTAACARAALEKPSAANRSFAGLHALA